LTYASSVETVFSAVVTQAIRKYPPIAKPTIIPAAISHLRQAGIGGWAAGGVGGAATGWSGSGAWFVDAAGASTPRVPSFASVGAALGAADVASTEDSERPLFVVAIKPGCLQLRIVALRKWSLVNEGTYLGATAGLCSNMVVRADSPCGWFLRFGRRGLLPPP
jgi:hypothetical protein